MEIRGEEAYGEMNEIDEWNVCEQSQDFSRYVRLESGRAKNFPDMFEWNLSEADFSRYVRMESERTENFPDMTKWNLSEANFQVGI